MKFFNSKFVALVILAIVVVLSIALGQKKKEDDFYGKLADDIRHDTQTVPEATTIPLDNTWSGIRSAVKTAYSGDFQNILLYDETGDVDDKAIKAIQKLNEEWNENLGLGVLFYINENGGISDYEACANELFYDLNLDESTLLIVISQGDGLFQITPGFDFNIEFSNKQVSKLTNILSVDYTRPSKMNEAIEDVCDYLDKIFEDAYDDMNW